MLNRFFDISDLDRVQLENIILNNVPDISLKNKNIGCLYEKPSTRTRISFSSGINNLYGNVIELELKDLNFSREESLEDTFKAFACYLDGLVFRTTSHKKLLLAHDLMQKPVINALSDKSHPCQIISDLTTLNEVFNTLELEISWFGDTNNVLFSLVEAANILDQIKLNIFSHKNMLNKINWKLNDRINLYDKIDKSVLKTSNCIMTDVFVSMNDNQQEDKGKLLSNFQINKNIMELTDDNCVFMHCLPAKIGQEVTKEVIEGPKSIVWKQATNRLPAQMRLMKCLNW